MSHQSTVLPLAIHGVRIGGIDLHREAVTEHHHLPVGVRHTMHGAVARRTAEGRIVLRAAVHAIERLAVVHRHLVELRQRKVRKEIPARRLVERFVQPTVAANEIVVRVTRIDPDHMVVDMLVLLAQPTERPARIVADHVVRIHQIHSIGVVRIRRDFGIVQATRARVAHPAPARANVRRAEHAALFICCLHHRIDHVRVFRADRQPDPTQFLGRQARRDLGPRRASVGRAMNRAFRTATHLPPHAPLPHLRRGEQDLRVARVHLHVVDADPFAAAKDARPRHATVSGLVQATLAPAVPCRTLRRDIGHVAVLRVDDDAPDVLRLLETDVLPGRTTVDRLEHAVAVAHRALVVVLTRAHPDHVRVVRIDGDRADRVGGLRVEDRRERRAGVRRLPHATTRRRDEPGARCFWVNGQVGDAPRHHCRPDAAPGESRNRRTEGGGVGRGTGRAGQRWRRRSRGG